MGLVSSVIRVDSGQYIRGCQLIRTKLQGLPIVALIVAFAAVAGCGTSSAPDNTPNADTTPPTVPTNLLVTAPAPTQVQLAWSASTDSGGSGLAGYRVFRNGSATPLASPTANSYTDTTVVASTTYTYTVRAFDAATPPNESGLTPAVAVTTPAAPVAGLDSRPSNTTCLAGAEPSATLAVTQVFANLTFSSPLAMMQAPGDAARWYVVEQAGRVRMFNNVATPAAPATFIDISGRVASGGETGLLGMAFHPNFPTDPRVFLSYTTTAPGPLTSRISSFTLASGGATLDPSSETVLLTVVQPESNHNGGNIAFGPEGNLYIGFGDGGSGNDPHNEPFGNGQYRQTVLGKMLRIDIGGPAATSYTIPATNPLAATGGLCQSGTTTDTDGCREIYAFGLRNPWRWSFDRGGNRDLWVGDVGQNAWEEVDRVVLGGNYGWRCREGAHATAGVSGCGTTGPFLDPVAEYDHGQGVSITGGYVYRGTAIPSLVGRYVFGDLNGGLWHIATNTTPPPTIQVTLGGGLNTGRTIASFGEGVNGELYIVDIGNGRLYQLAQGSGSGGSVATQLSASGCALASNPSQPSSGLIPYAPNAGFWSDGADKTRWLALPNGQNIDTSANDSDWNFPNGTVLRKDFRLGARLVETRLFMRHTSGNWAGYTYEWNAAATDATRVVGGKTVNINGQDYVFPSEAQCLACHTSAAGRSLGLETAQLNGNLLYPTTGRTANQIVTLNAINTLSPPINADPSTLPALPDPYGTSGTATERARAWLHTNCSFCHRPGGPTPSNMDLRYTTALAATNTCNAVPQSGDLGLPNARIVAPGTPGSSVLLERIDQRGTGVTMPPLASNLVDDQGVQLITAWISGLANCN